MSAAGHCSRGLAARPVQLRIVTAMIAYAHLAVVTDGDRCHAAEVLGGVQVAGYPVDRILVQLALAADPIADRKCIDEHSRLGQLLVWRSTRGVLGLAQSTRPSRAWRHRRMVRWTAPANRGHQATPGSAQALRPGGVSAARAVIYRTAPGGPHPTARDAPVMARTVTDGRGYARHGSNRNRRPWIRTSWFEPYESSPY